MMQWMTEDEGGKWDKLKQNAQERDKCKRSQTAERQRRGGEGGAEDEEEEEQKQEEQEEQEESCIPGLSIYKLPLT